MVDTAEHRSEPIRQLLIRIDEARAALVGLDLQSAQARPAWIAFRKALSQLDAAIGPARRHSFVLESEDEAFIRKQEHLAATAGAPTAKAPPGDTGQPAEGGGAA